MKNKNYCLADFEDREFCELCGDVATFLMQGYTVCRPCSKTLKKLKPIIEEEE